MSAPPSWDDQRVFLAVLEEGSLSGAARRLGIAQPTARARIEALEHALGAVLFTRSSQGLLPTDRARALHEHARAMALASEAFARAASGAPNEVAGVVRVSVSEMVGESVLPPMLARLRERHPGLRFEVAASNASADLTRQEADVAVRMHAPAQEALVRRKVGEVALGLFASPGYVARRGRPATLAELDGHDLIASDRAQADRRVEAGLLPPGARVVLRTDSHPGQRAAARAGLGIAVVQRPLGLADADLVPVLPDLVVGRIPLFLATHRDLRDVPRVRAAFDHLAEAFARYARG